MTEKVIVDVGLRMSGSYGGGHSAEKNPVLPLNRFLWTHGLTFSDLTLCLLVA